MDRRLPTRLELTLWTAVAIALVLALAMVRPAGACSGSLPARYLPLSDLVVVGTVAGRIGDDTGTTIAVEVDRVLRGEQVRSLRLENVRGHVCGDYLDAPIGAPIVLALGIDYRPMPDEPVAQIAAYWYRADGFVLGTADVPGVSLGEGPGTLEQVIERLDATLPPDTPPPPTVEEPTLSPAAWLAAGLAAAAVLWALRLVRRSPDG